MIPPCLMRSRLKLWAWWTQAWIRELSWAAFCNTAHFLCWLWFDVIGGDRELPDNGKVIDIRTGRPVDEEDAA